MIFIIILFICKLFKIKKRNVFLKTSNRYKLIILSKRYFFSNKHNFLFVDLNLLKIKPLSFVKDLDFILKQIKLNCPKVFNKPIDYKILKQLGINKNYPIYFEENINKNKLNLLLFAKTIVDFNLIIATNNNCSESFYEKIIELGVIIVDKKNISYKLLSCLNLSNINTSLASGLIIDNIQNGLEITGATNKLKFVTKTKEFKICECYESEELIINIEKFKFVDECYQITMQNKINSQKILNLNYYKSLCQNNINYYKFIKNKNNILCYNLVLGNYFYFKCSHKVKTNFSLIKNMKYSNLPQVQLNKKITLKPLECLTIEICKVLDLSKNFEKSYIELQEFYKKLFMFTLNSNDKNFDNLFNFELRENIILQQFDKFQNIKIETFTQGYTLYKLKKISALNFYQFILTEYLGVKITDKFLSIKPTIHKDFNILLNWQNKKFNIEVKHGKTKGMMVDGINFVNCCNIYLDRLNKISSISLVI